MTTTGPVSPTAAVNTNQGGGAVAWSGPTNVFASDDSRATAACGAFVGTQRLDVTGFDFSAIPDSATVDGIKVEVEKSVTSTLGTPVDATVQLLLAGIASGANKASGSTWPTTDAYSTYGSAADKWSLSLTGANLKASGFGIRVAGSRGAGKGSTTFRIDHVRMTVDWTASAPAPVLSVTGTADNGTYAFGSVPKNTLVSRQFTITNTGDASDTLGTLTISGTGWAISSADNPSGLTIAASATRTVTVTGNFPSEGSGQTGILTIPSSDAGSPYVINLTSSVMSAAVTGTATASIKESNIVAGGKTIIITLTNDTWVAAGATFNAQRQAIINGIDSAQAEATGWDAVVKALQGVAGVVRTSDTVVTITLDAQSTYNITAAETITVTVPSAALTGNGGAVVATPTFVVDFVPASSGPHLGTMGLLGVGK